MTKSWLAVLSLAAALAQTIEHEPEREHWQRISEIITAAGVGTGSMVADVGAGDGFLTVRLAPVVGSLGRVYAVDIDVARLKRLEKRGGCTALQRDRHQGRQRRPSPAARAVGCSADPELVSRDAPLR